MSDPYVAAAIADGRVPPEYTEAYLDENRDTPAIAAIIFVMILTALFVGARLVSRVFVLRKFGLDDGLAGFSLILMIPFVVLCVVLIQMGSGRHYEYIMYVMTMPTVELSERADFAAHIVYTTTLMFCRLSGLAFYHRICSLHDEFLLAIKILAGVLVAGFLPQLFLLIFHCQPVTGLWPYDWQPGGDEFTCLQWGLVYVTNSGISLFCDILLFGIPIAMLIILDVPRKRKVQLACILLPGILVVAISITRLILVVQGQWDPDESWSYNPLLAVEVSEIGATLIALSVPGVKPIFDRYVLRLDINSPTGGGSSNSAGGLGTVGSRRQHQLKLRPTHSMLTSSENVITSKNRDRDRNRERKKGGSGDATGVSGGSGDDYELESGLKDDHSTVSTDGILVKVDFDISEEQRDRARYSARDQYKVSK